MAIVTMPKVCTPPAASHPFYGGLMGSLMGGKGKDKKGDHKDWSKYKKGDWKKDHKKGDWHKSISPECKEAVEKLCGKCEKDMACWKKCKGDNRAAIEKACGGKKKDWKGHGHHDHQSKPLVGGGGGSIGPAWTYDPNVEKPAGKKDMGGWQALVYTEEQQKRLGVDETGKPVKPAAQKDEEEDSDDGSDSASDMEDGSESDSHHKHEHGEHGKGKKHHCWLGRAYHKHPLLCIAIGFLVFVLLTTCCIRCRRRRRLQAMMRRHAATAASDVPTGQLVHEGKVVGLMPVQPIPVSSRNTILAKEYLVEMASQSQQPQEDGTPIVQGQVVQT